MGDEVVLLVGTKKGGFIFEGARGRSEWSVRGPLCDGWPIHDMTWDASTGSIYAGGASPWYGAAVFRSDDLGRDVDPFVRRPDLRRRWAEDQDRLERDSIGGRAAGRRGAGWALPEHGQGRHLGARRGPAAPPLDARVAAGQRRPLPALDRRRPCQSATDVGRDLGRRDVPQRGRRCDLGDPEQGRPGGVPAGAIPRVRAVRPQARAGGRRLRRAPPAEPLRRLPQPGRRRELAGDHGRPARAVRVPDGRASARRLDRLGHPPQRRRQGPLHARRPAPPSGERATPATPGLACRRGCRLTTPTSACCARPWPSTGSIRPASISGRARASSTAAPTRASAGS